VFQNLSLKGFTWPREPVLYITLVASLLFAVASVITGEYTWVQGIEQVGILISGFIARGQVSPTP
jgi:hypothetical protein